MTDNSLSTHIESRSIFYDNFNINKNLELFLLVQQDKTRQLLQNVFRTTIILRGI